MLSARDIRRNSMIRKRIAWKHEWSEPDSYGELCSCRGNHKILILKNGKRICPVLFWARTCQVILFEKGNKEMLKWIKENPLEHLIRRDD